MVRKQFFETLPDGRDVHTWRLESADGVGLTVMDLGATILSLEVADRRGELADVVLGYDSAATYLSDPHFHGAVIGRFANRIAGARFALDGRTYDLDTNQPPNALHGGETGFDKRVWSGAILQHERRRRRAFHPGEHGWGPGLSRQFTHHRALRLDRG